MSRASDFLRKPAKPEPAQEKPADDLRKIILSDGREVILDDLSQEDRQNKRGEVLSTGKGYKQHYVRKRPPEPQLPSIFVAPDCIRKAYAYDDGLNERQKEYRRNVIDNKTLEDKTPKKVKNNNRQKWYQYILFNELVACKNGFLYYTIPLIISFVFLIFNIVQYNFLANMLFSVVALIDIIFAYKTLKSDSGIFIKALKLILLTAANIGLYYLGKLIPDFYSSIYLPFAIKILTIVFGIYYFGKFYVLFLLCYHGDCTLDFGNTVQINAGKPRSGKTSSGTHDCFILAKLKWRELQYDYWLWTSREDEIIARGNPDELLELHEIKLSYEFYIMRPCIPCLWTVSGVFDRAGRASHQITLAHLKGIERLPIYSVVCIDEIGALLRAEDGVSQSGKEKPVDVSDMFRLGGHFLKWVVIGCEQDFNHIYIDCRRVVGFNKVIYGQEWVCRPTVLYSIYKFLEWWKKSSLDKKMKKSPKWAKFMFWFGKFVKSIGFRKVKYSYAQNTETGAQMEGASQDAKMQVVGGKKVRYYPSILACDYDDRAYKQLYPSYFDKKIKGRLHKSKHLSGFDKKSFEFVNSTTALTEKRDSIESEIQKIA